MLFTREWLKIPTCYSPESGLRLPRHMLLMRQKLGSPTKRAIDGILVLGIQDPSQSRDIGLGLPRRTSFTEQRVGNPMRRMTHGTVAWKSHNKRFVQDSDSRLLQRVMQQLLINLYHSLITVCMKTRGKIFLRSSGLVHHGLRLLCYFTKNVIEGIITWSKKKWYTYRR